MINYILQVILFQVLFLAIYDFFLSKETFFTKNRWYLISTPIVSFILPFIKIPTFQKAVPEEFIIYLPEIVLSPEKAIQKTAMYQSINEVNYLNLFFYVGVAIFSILFLVKFFKIISLIRKNEIIRKPLYKLVLLPNQTKVFSFFNFIFLGKEIPKSQQKQIIAHEFVHSKQKHSFDLLFFEFLKIVMWFNPMIYFYQKRITLLHEYISDEVAAKSETKEMYINNLLSNFFQVENIAFVNQFYKQTFIKKRIIMMKKTQSKKMNQLKYLVLIPVLVSMLFYVSCKKSDVKEEQESISSVGNISDIRKKIKEQQQLKQIFFEEEIVEVAESVKLNQEVVPFWIVDTPPVHPDCNSSNKTNTKRCFSLMIRSHFFRNFNSDLLSQLGLEPGKKRVFVGFSIDKEGDVVDIKIRAPHQKIKAEVIKVMKSLPKMIPGEHSGKKISVNYELPVTLVVK